MNKKGESMVVGIISLVIMLILITGALLLVIHDTTTTKQGTDTLTLVNDTAVTVTTKTLVDVTQVINSTSFQINETTEWTQDTTTGTITLIDNAYNNTDFVVNYEYRESVYIDNTNERGMMILVALVVMIGALFAVLRLFNVGGV